MKFEFGCYGEWSSVLMKSLTFVRAVFCSIEVAVLTQKVNSDSGLAFLQNSLWPIALIIVFKVENFLTSIIRFYCIFLALSFLEFLVTKLPSNLLKQVTFLYKRRTCLSINSLCLFQKEKSFHLQISLLFLFLSFYIVF